MAESEKYCIYKTVIVSTGHRDDGEKTVVNKLLTMRLFGWNLSRRYFNWIYPPYKKQQIRIQL